MLFKYKAINKEGEGRTGTIESGHIDLAITALQDRGLIISSINPEKGNWFSEMSWSGSVSNKDVVVLSQQIATLFEAQVSALQIFRLLSEEVDNPVLADILDEVANDIKGGGSISSALSKHPKVFSEFYVHMVEAGEEAGKLSDIFSYLAKYLDRMYDLTHKAKNALIYPAIVVAVFFLVLVLMLTVIIPQIAQIIESSGDIPFYTQIILNLSKFLIAYGLYLLAGLIISAGFFYKWVRSRDGKELFGRILFRTPLVGDLLKKMYLTRIADNMSTMLSSGVSMTRSLEVTSGVVGSAVFSKALKMAVDEVHAGETLSEALSKSPEIPGVMIQMIRVGEETGSVGKVLETLSGFYRREFSATMDSLISLIEPALIVFLGVAVGALLIAVLIPIYNITGGAGL